MTVATWVSQDVQLGATVPGTIDAVAVTAAGVNIGPLVPVGTVKRYYDNTGVLGMGEFIYLPGVAALAAGDVVTYTISAGVAAATDASVVRWAGVANTPAAIAVATAANTSATTFSWYQIGGAAIVNTSGAVVVGDKAFWQATATVSSAVVAGKQVESMIAASANGVPGANKAIYTLNRPSAQGQIT